MTIKSRLALALPLFLALALGCGPDSPTPASISGKITYGPTDVTGGQITFHPQGEGPSYTRPIAADATYSAADLPVGQFTVTIETESINPDRKAPDYGGSRGGGGKSPAPAAAPQGNPGTYVKIPPKYADVKTSGLTVTLTKGSQKKDFPLTD
jgi:hypothetical protein